MFTIFFCKLQLPVASKRNNISEFKLTDLSTQNCLLSNGLTFITFIIMIFFLFAIFFIIIYELKITISRKRRSNKFRAKKRFKKEFPKGFEYEMKEKNPNKVLGSRSNEIYKKHGVNFPIIFKSDAESLSNVGSSSSFKKTLSKPENTKRSER